MNTYIKINSMDGNTWSPDAYPQGWTEVTA